MDHGLVKIHRLMAWLYADQGKKGCASMSAPLPARSGTTEVFRHAVEDEDAGEHFCFRDDLNAQPLTNVLCMIPDGKRLERSFRLAPRSDRVVTKLGDELLHAVLGLTADTTAPQSFNADKDLELKCEERVLDKVVDGFSDVPELQHVVAKKSSTGLAVPTAAVAH